MAVDTGLTGLTGLINRPRTIHRGSCSDGGHFVDTNTVLYVTFSGQTNAYDGATNSAGRRCVRNEGCQSRAQSLCRSVATGTSNGPFAPNRGPSESLLSVARVPDLNGTLIRVAGA